jgi:hypothetical protein
VGNAGAGVPPLLLAIGMIFRHATFASVLIGRATSGVRLVLQRLGLLLEALELFHYVKVAHLAPRPASYTLFRASNLDRESFHYRNISIPLPKPEVPKGEG